MKHHSPKTQATGSYAKMKQPCPGVVPGTGSVSSQMNPRRDRREDYTPDLQGREAAVKI